MEAKSTEEVELLNKQMHVAEVDLNYALYHPLSEVYIGLYPRQDPKDEDNRSKEAEPKAKPPMWAEVEKCMEKGTLDRLRNRAPELPPSVSRPLQKRPAKAKPPPPEIDMTGMNRRERRSQRGVKDTKTKKNKSMAFAKNEAFGAEESARKEEIQAEAGDDSDGGFFE